ncbi:MAG: bifunctional diaminohydroxyphosphoribosylaminopyrimidine deaminase/5-amino-6-(5-phosphoribosylamino)uracil reductase RibD [Candidatus Omnitrophica bacterium]|nr:bifunctional diaminohydroxyphosphoribosylaminopyrimidine deaminase/5-amino-6-(5-phosphoribosylamino)uracil reductase RibD [Candidatus Omnitrophota bacterium]
MADSRDKYMDLALKLSLKAKGLTSPNPLVGAVIVKDNKIISTGFHRSAGSDHAELVALKKAGAKAKGATLYVTLEPCSSFGRTPPCTQAIIKSGIKKVVIGMVDPNPLHRGKGIKILNAHRIKTDCGVLEEDISEINQPFIKYITKNISYITLKVAQSLDGRIALRNGESKWITSRGSRRFAHGIRSDFDAIMVGINTVLKDDPSLSPCKSIKNKKFYKIVLDTNIKAKQGMRIFSDARRFPVIIAASKGSVVRKPKAVKSLVKKGAIILGIEARNGLLDIKDLLRKLAQLEIINILVEGGGRVVGSLLDEGSVDYAMFFIAPKIIGGKDSILSIQGKGINRILDATRIGDIKIKRFGEDLLLEGKIKKY